MDQLALFLVSLIHAVLAVVLLSGLLRRRSSSNAGEARPPFKLWCTGFMFRRRGALLRRLARLASHEAQRPVEALLKRLQNSQLEALGLVVENRGAEPGPCLPMRAADLLRLERSGPALPPHLIFCQLWRWAELRTTQELRPLPFCQNMDVDPLYVCCNPYHWSRLYKPDSPPPPYKVSQEKSIILESAPSESRFSSNFSGSSETPSRPWCNIAYWELSNRVGRLLPVSQPSINVFADLPQGDGLCLETLAQSRLTSNTSVLQTRAKIGQGITIFREDQEVWVYNRSDYPVFVNSPTLDPPNTENLTVYKLLPGYSIKIFDYERSLVNQRLQDPSLLKDGPFDPYAVRVSFAKGWGSSKYSRRFITSCPCWLEVMFRVNR